MSNQKIRLRLIWKGKKIRENALLIFEKNTQTRLLSHSWLPRVCTDTPAPCLDASAPTRLPRRVCADASAPTRARRGVCTDTSAPTGPGRRVHAEASAPTRLLRPVRAEPSTPTRQFRWVCADASAPTRLHRRVCADASALARQNMDFSLKNCDSARDLLKKLEKTLSEITTFAKN